MASLSDSQAAGPIRQLWGGALTASIPQSYLDVSTIREVPDAQEVFLERDGLVSISLDLLSREQVDAQTDEVVANGHVDGDFSTATDVLETRNRLAVRAHVEDICPQGSMTSQIESVEVPGFDTNTYTAYTTTAVPSPDPSANTYDPTSAVLIQVLLIRYVPNRTPDGLPDVGAGATDILVTITVPDLKPNGTSTSSGDGDVEGFVRGLDGPSRAKVEAAEEMRLEIIQSFTLVDPGLFCV